MSKYGPLRVHLSLALGDEITMSFAEIEDVLGFTLPPSARRHPAWWSNNVGTHVNAAAWRSAGWKTAQVNVPGERVTFVREKVMSGVGVAEGATPFAMDADARSLASAALLRALSPGARRVVDDWREARGVDAFDAVVEALDALGKSRQKQLVESLPMARMPPGHDSVALIREDRERD